MKVKLVRRTGASWPREAWSERRRLVKRRKGGPHKGLGLALWQNHMERILAEWIGELAVTIDRGREGLAQDETGADVARSELAAW